MAVNSARQIIPHYRDPIRIVPLHLPGPTLDRLKEAGPAPAAKLTYRGGPLLTGVKVFSIYWGAGWENTAQKSVSAYLDKFFGDVLTSALIDQLTEYSVPAFAIGHGSFAGSAVITTPAPSSTTSDAAIRHMLQQETAGGTQVPAPDANTLYFVFLPPGVQVVQGGSRSCQAFCGYHDDISGSLFYAVMPYPNCNGCTGGLSVQDALTSTSSHELCEAITDPVPGQGWYDDANGEIGDICAWKTKKLGEYTVQLEWSNRSSACI